MNYYNEIDPYCCKWLMNLIEADLIPMGNVDNRSIEDVQPEDLEGYTQCHFFAGIAGWAYALELAGVPRDAPIWTGSCPCQPLSSAGQRKGHADRRHLWPAFQHLIAECRPPIVFGEQVASKDGREWFSAVRADLERVGYACGGSDLPAASMGAPHLRQRLFWVAHNVRGGSLSAISASRTLERLHGESFSTDEEGRVGNASSSEKQEKCRVSKGEGTKPRGGWDRGLGDSNQQGPQGRGNHAGKHSSQSSAGEGSSTDRVENSKVSGGRSQHRKSEPSNGWIVTSGGSGAWSSLEYLQCADGKARPVKPGIQPLAHGLPGSVRKISPVQRRLAAMAGLDGPSLSRAKKYRIRSLRAYGNAIVSSVAAKFIEAAMECISD